MFSPNRPKLNWTAIIAFVAVFVVVASATGGGTYALLSDQESVPASLTIEPDVETEIAAAASSECSEEMVSSDSAEANLSILESKAVEEQQSCTRITFLVNQSTFNTYTPDNADPNNTVLMHHDGTGWQPLNTSSSLNSSAGPSGFYNFTAYADSVSSFRIAVPNPPTPTQTSAQNTSVTTTDNESSNKSENEIEYGEGPVVPGSVTDFRNAVEDPNRSVSKEDARTVTNSNDGVQVTEFSDDTVVINYSDGTEVEYDRRSPSDNSQSKDTSSNVSDSGTDKNSGKNSNNGNGSDSGDNGPRGPG